MKSGMVVLALACAVQLFQFVIAKRSASELINSLDRYDRHQNPSGKDNVTLVGASMWILNVFKVDDINQQITTQMYFRQIWNDSRLQYGFGETKVIMLELKDLDRLWKPDLFFVDEIHGKMNDIVFPNALIHWHSNGKILFSVRVTMTSSCPMDFSCFPHDTQKCSFYIESYSHTASTLQLKWVDGKKSVGITDTIADPNFDNTNIEYKEETAPVADRKYSRLIVELTLKRKVGFYVTKLYVPYVLLTLISFLSLWINPRYVHLRLVLLLSILLIMFLLALDISDYIPRVAYTKAIDVWMAVNMAMVFALLLESIYLAQSIYKQQHVGELKEDVEIVGKSEKEKGALSKLFPLNVRLFSSEGSDKTEKNRKIDVLSRFFSFALFGFFNMIYWSVFAS